MDPQVERARSILLGATGFAFSPQKDPADVVALKKTANVWRSEAKYLDAGWAMEAAAEGSWGNGDEVERCAQQSLKDYQACISSESPLSAEAFAAFAQLLSALHLWFLGSANALIRQYERELSRRLIDVADESGHRVAYLVTGFQVSGDFQKPWTIVLPGEQPPSNETAPARSGVKIVFGSATQQSFSGRRGVQLSAEG